MIIAGPGRKGPYPIKDLPTPFDAPPVDADAPYAELRARAATHVMSLPRDHADRPVIDYILWRMRQPDGVWLHARLADIIRPRNPGAAL